MGRNNIEVMSKIQSALDTPAQSRTAAVLSILRPHTSIQWGNTVRADAFSWMVGKVSLG